MGNADPRRFFFERAGRRDWLSGDHDGPDRKKRREAQGRAPFVV